MSLAMVREAVSRSDLSGARSALDRQVAVYERVASGSFCADLKAASHRELEASAAYLVTAFFDVPLREAVARGDEDESARLLARTKMFCDRLSTEVPALRSLTRRMLSEAYDAVVPFTDRQMELIASILLANSP